MAILEYVKPMEFSTGQVVGRANLGVLRDNDDYFNALADRYIPVPAGQVTAWESDTVSRVAWDGWHLKRTDMDTLYYYAELLHDDPLNKTTTLTGYYDYNDDFNQTTMFTIALADNTASGTVDLSGFPNGLYRVTYIMTRGAATYDATATIRVPYTIYTGAEAYGAGPAFTDGNVSAAADFNDLRSNDIYFNAITPSQTASVGMVTETTSTNTIEIFNGWDKWHPDHNRLYYRVYMQEYVTDNDVITVYYDADDVDGIQSTNLATGTGWTESHWDIPDGGFTKGNWYRVRVVLDPDANSGYRLGLVDYLFITADGLDAAYTVMDPFTVGQFVYGDTVGEDTRLELLTDNDASIYDRLTWGNSNPGRMDFACFEPEFHGFNGGWFYGNYRLKRVGDTLYYRTQGAVLVLPDGSTESLEDYSGSGDYNTLDLNSLDLPHGSVYTIRRASWPNYTELATPGARITDELLEFAMEV